MWSFFTQLVGKLTKHTQHALNILDVKLCFDTISESGLLARRECPNSGAMPSVGFGEGLDDPRTARVQASGDGPVASNAW